MDAWKVLILEKYWYLCWYVWYLRGIDKFNMYLKRVDTFNSREVLVLLILEKYLYLYTLKSIDAWKVLFLEKYDSIDIWKVLLLQNILTMLCITESKNHTEKVYFGYTSINIDFYVKILLIKVKEHENLYKMVYFILVLGSILSR